MSSPLGLRRVTGQLGPRVAVPRFCMGSRHKHRMRPELAEMRLTRGVVFGSFTPITAAEPLSVRQASRGNS
ncbi:MAG: hypothetical protein ACU0B7_05785 [Paracoccaceae bacterium]|uniref:hypothetical protein n=1 Tax=Seohaeicola saemankumensis TaxID=481181 RepID=UPI001E32B065|nr:hypothetical protein [Seohaeicola saemankumensis]MCD1625415.1 hypothetical protein [Seohaeicola saemankumensis]